MNSLLLVRDMGGFYMAASWIRLRPGEDLAILYLPDPTDWEEAREAVCQDFSSSRRLITSPAWDLEGFRSWSDIMGTLPELEAPIYLGGDPGGPGPVLEVPLLEALASDGRLGRGYGAHILRDYLARAGAFKNLVLASPSLGVLGGWAQVLADEGDFNVIAPLEVFSKTLPLKKGRGQVEFFWKERNFDLERRLQEVFGFRPSFRTYHSHPWLRGRGLAEKKEGR